jgi:hypothetical protein
VQHRTGSQEPESVLSEPPVGRHTPTISWPTPKPACHGLELRCFQAWDGRMGRYGPGNGTGWDGLCQLCTFYRVLPRLSPRGPLETSPRDLGLGVRCSSHLARWHRTCG